MKTKRLIYISVTMLILGFTSCLDSGLDHLVTYSDADVTAINFEHRWSVPENPNDPWAGEKLQVKGLITKATFVDGTIKCDIVVPAVSGSFTVEERDKVTLEKLNAYVTISPGATIKANGSTPNLGKLGNFNQADMSYQVIAADGSNNKDWKLVINSFTK